MQQHPLPKSQGPQSKSRTISLFTLALCKEIAVEQRLECKVPVENATLFIIIEYLVG